MSLPPYKHKRNPCLQTQDEPLIPGLAGAPLITYRCVQEKRRTSDQRVAKIQNMAGVEFEYEYMPAQIDVLPKERMIKPDVEDHDHQQNPESKPVNSKGGNKQGLRGASGDQPNTVCDNNECAARIETQKNVVRKSNDQGNLKDGENDTASTCSRRSSISHCSQSSQKTESSRKSQKSIRRSDSRESLSSTLNAVLKTHGRKQEKSAEFRFQKFGKIANGLDDDDLRPRRQ